MDNEKIVVSYDSGILDDIYGGYCRCQLAQQELDKWTSTSSSSTTVSNGEMTLPPQSNRWIKISENRYYTTYGDSRTLKASGQAQDRRVEGYFKREYTPLGSQWLGNISNGAVKPDIITHSIYGVVYGVSSARMSDMAKYYDVHNNLIYNGNLPDIGREYYSSVRYTPDSEQEQIKDRLFHAFGWDY